MQIYDNWCKAKLVHQNRRSCLRNKKNLKSNSVVSWFNPLMPTVTIWVQL